MVKEIDDLSKSNKILNIYMSLDRCPVGVKYLNSKEEYDSIQASVRKTKVTYCNSVNLASRGEKLKLLKGHQACIGGSTALGFEKYNEDMLSGKTRLKRENYADLETSKSVSDEMKFNDNYIYGVLVSPIDKMEVEPDVIIVIGKSYNIMRLIQGYSYNYGYATSIKTVGLQAICHDLTTAPIISDSVNISFLCPGTRLVADWQPDEIGIGISFSKWYKTVQGVVSTTNAFVRNDEKEKIIKKLDDNGMDSNHIKLNQNYDTGLYKGGLAEI
ncbi:DUF169 domain-containing protein [Anaerococcus sp. DFU013_CI05]|uniref:DUF169 domain-containing protein n=1 Tax=Anaerococcus sp. AH8042_DFU013_CI05 TaxID=3385202 RepID=UPI003A5214D3